MGYTEPIHRVIQELAKLPGIGEKTAERLTFHILSLPKDDALIGLGAAMARPLQVALFDVNPNDPTVYATIVAAFALAGLAACVIPARRATREFQLGLEHA